jgi:hypothetical protein
VGRRIFRYLPTYIFLVGIYLGHPESSICCRFFPPKIWRTSRPFLQRRYIGTTREKNPLIFWLPEKVAANIGAAAGKAAEKSWWLLLTCCCCCRCCYMDPSKGDLGPVLQNNMLPVKRPLSFGPVFAIVILIQWPVSDPGWPGDFFGKMAQNVDKLIFLPKLIHYCVHGPNIWATSVILINIPEVKSHPIGENSPNLVTLLRACHGHRGAVTIVNFLSCASSNRPRAPTFLC